MCPHPISVNGLLCVIGERLRCTGVLGYPQRSSLGNGWEFQGEILVMLGLGIRGPW